MQHNIFVLSAQFGTPAQIMEYQRQAVTALFAGFIGAFAFCLFRFYQDIVAGRFSPGSLVLSLGHTAGGERRHRGDVARRRGDRRGDAGFVQQQHLVCGQRDSWCRASAARPLLLQQAWARLWEWDEPAPAARTLQAIDGLNFRARRQLALFRITDVQNLATASPLLLATATDFGLPEIIDWIGQARMVMRLGDQAQVNSLRARSVRTIFHLVDAAGDNYAAGELGRALLDAASASSDETTKPPGTDDSLPDRGAKLILRIADSERSDPQFQRLEAIRSATGMAAASPPSKIEPSAPPASSAVPDEVSVVRVPQVTMQRWTEQGTHEALTKLAFAVDLAREPREASDTGKWAALVVKVRLFSPAVDFEDEEAIVLVRRGDASVPGRIVGTLRSDEVQIKVRALFYVGARFSGALVKTFPMTAAVGADLVSCADGTGNEEQPRLPNVLTFSDREPDLTVTVTVDQDNPARQSWSVDSAALTRANGYMHSRRDDRVEVNDPANFFARYREILETQNTDRLKDLLHTLGLELFGRAPACFRQAYWFLRERNPDFSIQFMTDDGQTPVELMVPYRGREELDLLSAMHPMARWLLPRFDDGIGGDLVPNIPHGMVAAMAPDYSAREDVAAIPNLSAIRDYYASRDTRWFDGVTGVLKSLLRSSYPVSILLFYGHGKAGNNDRDFLLSLSRRQSGGTRDRQRQNNARAALQDAGGAQRLLHWRRALGSVSEWPTTLMKRSFGGIIAPLWDVDTFQAHEMSKSLLDDILRSHRQISNSLRDLKAGAFADGGIPAALAYVFHGDVTARVE